MITLLQRMHDELVRRHYAASTIESYLKIVEAFRRHAGKRLDRLGPDDLRRYHVFLLEDRKLAVGTVVIHISALRFFYLRVLKRRDMKEDLPYPKYRRRLPTVLSPEERAAMASPTDIRGAQHEVTSAASSSMARRTAAILVGVDLSEADCTDALLLNANLSETNLRSTIFRGARLQGANLEGALRASNDVVLSGAQPEL